MNPRDLLRGLAGSTIIVIEGLGNVPSFKNKKRMGLNRKTKRPIHYTEPKTKQWMKDCVTLIASQLSSRSRTCESVTSPG